jgi:hypothetical protein
MPLPPPKTNPFTAEIERSSNTRDQGSSSTECKRCAALSRTRNLGIHFQACRIGACRFGSLWHRRTQKPHVDRAKQGCQFRDMRRRPAALLSFVAAIAACNESRPEPPARTAATRSEEAAAKRRNSATSRPDFEGKLRFRLTGKREVDLLIEAKGVRARLETPELGGAPERIVLLRPAPQPSVLSFPNAERYQVLVPSNEPREARAHVELERTAESGRVAGVSCERWRLTDPEYVTVTCVTRTGPRLNPELLARAAPFELPPWVWVVLDEGAFPLTFDMTPKRPGRRWSGEVVELVHEPVPDTAFEVPPDHKPASVP